MIRNPTARPAVPVSPHDMPLCTLERLSALRGQVRPFFCLILSLSFLDEVPLLFEEAHVDLITFQIRCLVEFLKGYSLPLTLSL